MDESSCFLKVSGLTIFIVEGYGQISDGMKEKPLSRKQVQDKGLNDSGIIILQTAVRRNRFLLQNFW